MYIEHLPKYGYYIYKYKAILTVNNYLGIDGNWHPYMGGGYTPYWATRNAAETFLENHKMKKNNSIQAKIDQCESDIEALNKNLLSLKEKLARPTYKVGDILSSRKDGKGTKVMLVETKWHTGDVALIIMQEGSNNLGRCYSSYSVTVKDIYRITQDELDMMSNFPWFPVED
jgi:hypothetical protein